jgi:hypothetical protein
LNQFRLSLGQEPIMNFSRKFFVFATLFLFAGPVASAFAQESVGNITQGFGEIIVTRAAGGDEAVVIGAAVFQHDTIFVGEGSEATITFADNTILTLGAESAITIDTLIYDPAGQDSSASFDLAGGLMGLVSGDIVKTGNMIVTTPVSTIGIRGTTVLIDSGYTVTRNANGSYSFSGFSQNGQQISLTISPDGTTGTVNVLSPDGSSTTLAQSGDAVVIGDDFSVTAKTVDAAELTAKFGAIVTALQTATGSDLVGTVDGDVGNVDAIEDAIQELLDLIENPAQDDEASES